MNKFLISGLSALVLSSVYSPQTSIQPVQSTSDSFIQVLNDPRSSEHDYISAINQVPDSLPVYTLLRSPESRKRFLEQVISQDLIDSYEYKSPKGCASETRMEKNPDLECFNCRHFVRNFHFTYTTEDISSFTSDEDPRYTIDKADLKFRIPTLYEVAYSAPGINGDKLFSHVVMGAYLGDPRTPFNIRTDPNEWYFFDAMSDEHFFHPDLSYRNRGDHGVLTIIPKEDQLPYDRLSLYPTGGSTWQNDSSIHFYISGDNTEMKFLGYGINTGVIRNTLYGDQEDITKYIIGERESGMGRQRIIDFVTSVKGGFTEEELATFEELAENLEH